VILGIALGWAAAATVSAFVLGAAAWQVKEQERVDRQRAAGLTTRVRRSPAARDLRRAAARASAAVRRVLHGGASDRALVWAAVVVLGGLVGGLLLGLSTRGFVWDGFVPTSVASVLQERAQ
jgi:hypothetical protein